MGVEIDYPSVPENPDEGDTEPVPDPTPPWGDRPRRIRRPPPVPGRLYRDTPSRRLPGQPARDMWVRSGWTF